MPIKPLTILTINPSSKEIGFAVLHGTALYHFGVRTIKQRSSLQEILVEVMRWLQYVIQEYAPVILSIEESFGSQQDSVLFATILAQLKMTAQQNGLQIFEYNPAEVRKFFCQTEKATRRETARYLISKYPELAGYFHRTSPWEIKYWSQMFDAVAVGLMCALQLLSSNNEMIDSS